MRTVNEIDDRGELIGNRTIQKLRIRILPFLFVLYVICYLDRVNISIAALTMNRDLVITSKQFGLLTGLFFIGYFLFEIPSNLLLHKIGARIWIARILISWGVIATLTGFVQNVHQLYWARFLLGLAEAGYVPGVCLYLTYWFPKREQARALALFLLGLPVSSIHRAACGHTIGMSERRAAKSGYVNYVLLGRCGQRGNAHVIANGMRRRGEDERQFRLDRPTQ
jgi:hypothetical protein